MYGTRSLIGAYIIFMFTQETNKIDFPQELVRTETNLKNKICLLCMQNRSDICFMFIQA